MKNLINLLLFSFTLIGLSEVHHWWLLNDGILVHSIFQGSRIEIDPKLLFAERRSKIAINPSDASCWVTNSFQGQVTKYNVDNKKPLILKGFAAPTSLALSSDKIWAIDSALNRIVTASLDGKIIKTIPIQSAKSMVVLDGDQWVLTWRGLQKLTDDGLSPAILTKVTHVTTANQHIWCLDQKGLIYTFRSQVNLNRAKFSIPDAVDIVSTDDGGAWLLRHEMVIRLTDQLIPVGEITGVKNPKRLIRQPTDHSVWLIDTESDRSVRLPRLNDPSDVKLIAAIGWNQVRNTKRVKTIIATDLKWNLFSRNNKREQSSIAQSTEDSKVKIRTETNPPTVKARLLLSKPIASKTKDLEPIAVPISPNETFDHVPVFPNGGLVSVELYNSLSQKRIQNTGQMLGRRFIWNFEGETYTLLVGLSLDVYNTYSNRDRLKWIEMVVEGSGIGQPIAEKLNQVAQENNWSRERLANFVISFVQSLPYTADDVATGYDEFKMYAFETLVAGGGDCEDTVILAASLLRSLSYDLILLNPKGHLALGVSGQFSGAHYEYNNLQYFYSETTGKGWEIGNIPEAYRSIPVKLYQVPLLTP